MDRRPPNARATALLAVALAACAGCASAPPDHPDEDRAVCGDGRLSAAEGCDDGAWNGVTACPYGQHTCTGCSATCTPVALTGPYCGDDVLTAAHEECDARSSFNCGTCEVGTCRNLSPHGARGTITVTSAAVSDSHGFILDGGMQSPVEYEFNASGSCYSSPSHWCIDVVGVTSTAVVAQRIAGAVNGAAAEISAAIHPDDPSQVDLTNAVPGRTGDRLITTVGNDVVVAPAQGTIVVRGMYGGTGCEYAEPCARDADCLQGYCHPINRVCN